MKHLRNILRAVIGIGGLVIALLGSIILFSRIGIDGLEDYFIFGSITFASCFIGISAFFFKKIPTKSWYQLILISLLVQGIAFFIGLFIEKDFQHQYLVTAGYIAFLALACGWITFSNNQSRESQTQWVAAFLGFTMLEISFGMIQSVIKGALVLIICLMVLLLLIWPRRMKKKTSLLFLGKHQELRKTLVPKLIPHDGLLQTYSYLYAGELSDFYQSLEWIDEKMKEKKSTALFFEYVSHDFALYKGFFTGDVTDLHERFQRMKALNKTLFKKGYPMATAYILVYLMGLYEDEALFLQEVTDALAFEKAYNFKHQPEAFYPHLAFEHEILEEAMAYKRGEGIARLESLEKVAIQPIYRGPFREALTQRLTQTTTEQL